MEFHSGLIHIHAFGEIMCKEVHWDSLPVVRLRRHIQLLNINDLVLSLPFLYFPGGRPEIKLLLAKELLCEDVPNFQNIKV